MRQLTDRVRGVDNAQSALIRVHSEALIKQTSTILSIVSTTPDTIADLKAMTIMHARKQAAQAHALETGITEIASHVKSLSQIGVTLSGAISRQTSAMRRCIRRLASLMQDIKKLLVL